MQQKEEEKPVPVVVEQKEEPQTIEPQKEDTSA
jgi:hypothetical protein